MKWGQQGGISIDADSGPLGYVLWCCGGRSQDFLTFVQICTGHTVSEEEIQLIQLLLGISRLMSTVVLILKGEIQLIQVAYPSRQYLKVS